MKRLTAFIRNLPVIFIAHLFNRELQRVYDRQERARTIARNFKMEITETMWGKKVKLVQRDKPLTDDELKELLKK